MIIAYCVSCGSPLTKHTPTYYSCQNGHDFYNNPHTATAVALINDKAEILYSRRAHEPRKDLHDLPGGFVEFDEDPAHAIRREAREEMGVKLGPLQFLTTATHTYRENVTTTDLVYICTSWQGEPTPADDVAELSWRPLEFMVSDKFAWREMYRPVYTALQEYFTDESR